MNKKNTLIIVLILGIMIGFVVIYFAIFRTQDIEGEGFLKTRGGDVRTCAGQNVYLIESKYFDEYKDFETDNDLLQMIESYYDNRMNRGYSSIDINDDERQVLEFIYQKFPDIYKEGLEILKGIVPKNLQTPYYMQTFMYNDASYMSALRKAKKILEEKVAKSTFKPQIIAETKCDSNGQFLFKNIPHGEYGISTNITWNVMGIRQGGFRTQLIKVDNNLQKVVIGE